MLNHVIMFSNCKNLCLNYRDSDIDQNNIFPITKQLYLAVPLAVLALLADPVDGVEVVVRAHPRDGLLQEVQQVGGAAGHPAPVGHDVVRT